jgi:creatinine amidohydrolase
MKPATVFLGEMTNPEVEAFLKSHHTVIVPTGATEQHGPHAPLLTDVLIPNEIARRVAPTIGAVVAPPINYALSYPHVGFTGLVHIRIPTFMSLVEDLCASFAASGFKRIIFLNGHYDNTYAIAYACANAADRMPKDVKAFPVNYWDGLTAEEVAEFSTLKNGLHANRAETSAVLAINPALVDMDKANAEFPPFPDYTVNTGPVHTAFFFSAPGSVYWATKSGTWGDARKSTPEIGERYLEAGVRSTLLVLDNIERTFTAMPPR